MQVLFCPSHIILLLSSHGRHDIGLTATQHNCGESRQPFKSDMVKFCNHLTSVMQHHKSEIKIKSDLACQSKQKKVPFILNLVSLDC